jgi:hypothetical protein
MHEVFSACYIFTGCCLVAASNNWDYSHVHGQPPNVCVLTIELGHGPHRKHHFQQFLYCCVHIHCCRNVFTKPLSSSGCHLGFYYSSLQAFVNILHCYRSLGTNWVAFDFWKHGDNEDFKMCFTSYCNYSISLLYIIFLYIIQSSAKSQIVDSVFLQLSFTYARHSSVPSTLPCGTPDVTDFLQ